MVNGAFRTTIMFVVLLILTSMGWATTVGSGQEKTRPILAHIVLDNDQDLVSAASELSWPGDGSANAPYIIDGLNMDALGKGACLYLGNISLHVRVVNCTFRGTSPRSSFMPGAGMVIWNCTNVVVDRCTAKGNLYGIYTIASRGLTLSNCTLRNARNDIALVLTDSTLIENNDLSGSDEGLLLQSCHDNILKHNNLSLSSTLSMGVYQSSRNVFRENLFHNNTGEAYVYLSDSNTIDHNRFMDNEMALKVSWSPYNTINKNVFARNSLANYIVSSRHNAVGSCTLLDNTIGFYLHSSDYNEVRNCWIDGSSTAVRLRDSKNDLVYGCVITYMQNGVSIEGDSDNNRVTDCVLAGLEGITDAGVRLTSMDAWNNHLRHNTVTGCEVGLSISDQDMGWVDENIISSCGTGILLDGASRSNVTKNMLSDCPKGVECLWPYRPVEDRLLLEGNLIRNCSERGIMTDLGTGGAADIRALEVKGNRVERCGEGIMVKGSQNDRFERNRLLLNEVGLSLVGCVGDLLYDNYLNNVLNVQLDDCTRTVWNISRAPGTNIVFGPYLGGNFWSDYNGSDLDGDGLGDEFVPFGPGDHHPLVRDTFTPIITDLTEGTPETGGTFRLMMALEDRPTPQELEVDLDYELTGPDGLVVAEGKDVGQKHWKDPTFSKMIDIPHNAVLLRYRFRATDRGGNSEGLFKELKVKDTIPPNVTLTPMGRAGTGEDLVLNLTVRDNTYHGSLVLTYGTGSEGAQLGNVSYNLEGGTGTLFISPTISVPQYIVVLSLTINCSDMAGNQMEELSLFLNVTDLLPPIIGTPMVTPLHSGLKLSFATSITDNIGVERADLKVTWGGGRALKVPLSAQGLLWSVLIDVPLNAARTVWRIEAIDLQGNPAAKDGYIDLQLPMSVLSDATVGTPMTGRPFRLAFEEIYGLLTLSRTITWWTEAGSLNSSSGVSNLTIIVPINAVRLGYSYRVVDTYGVEADIYGEKDVLDIIPPTIMVNAGSPANGKPLTVRWSAKDNIAVRHSFVRCRFDGSSWNDLHAQGQMAVVNVPDNATVMELEGHVMDDASIENVSTLMLEISDPIGPVVSMFELVFIPKNDTVRVMARFKDNRGPGTALVNWYKEDVDQGRLELTNAWSDVLVKEVPVEGFRGEVSFKVVLIDRSGNRFESQPYSLHCTDGRTNEGTGGVPFLALTLVISIIVVLSAVLYLWLKRRAAPPNEE